MRGFGHGSSPRGCLDKCRSGASTPGGARLEARALFGGLDRLAKAPPYVAFGLLWTMRRGHAVEGLLPPLKQTSVLVANMSA